jgi:hypothetical protein
LHPNIGLAVFDPKYNDDIKSELKHKLILLNSIINEKSNEKKGTDENSL